ncbi:hypothetical protein COV86_01415 [Candidatus Roizmanbacteria bacterium CG11_big_fil_rev_8_21_14_0_20_35_14]|uniref:DUF5666 domain-containing protein n=2 Tax=Candidatus Roizmaniibacteriota TaxID=1752723 RepID=A0A2H0KNB4_9BACT|nr:MAG: hypothetical protein COV86_01415 [Candidatus Roizmanbacteria bacterium CG11_big_fil_rev_8_21_14_0_20_35_14]
MKNNIVLIIVLALLVGGLGFYGGMKYQQSQRVSFSGQFNNRQGIRSGTNSRGGFQPVSGEIIASDDKSITVKLQDGSSKIILLSDKTQINKAETVDKSQLKTGEKVAVFGTENTDGSVTATNIQLNPIVRAGQPPVNNQ